MPKLGSRLNANIVGLILRAIRESESVEVFYHSTLDLPGRQELTMITFDLSTNNAEALLRHCVQFIPQSDDAWEDRRLENALLTLAEALRAHLELE